MADDAVEKLVSCEAALDPSTVTFKPDTILRLFSQQWDGKTKGNSDGMKLSAEYLRCFVVEAAFRASKEAQTEHAPQVDREHLEKILPQLLLDF